MKRLQEGWHLYSKAKHVKEAKEANRVDEDNFNGNQGCTPEKEMGHACFIYFTSSWLQLRADSYINSRIAHIKR